MHFSRLANRLLKLRDELCRVFRRVRTSKIQLGKASNQLQQLREKLCGVLRRGESYWYGQASDYQSSYGDSSEYDKGYKHSYLNRGGACLQAAERIESLPLPTRTEDVEPFVKDMESKSGGLVTGRLQYEIETLIERARTLSSRVR